MINRIWTANRSQWSIKDVSGSLFLLSKNRLSDNKSKKRAITIFRDRIMPPKTKEAKNPKNGSGENKNAKKLKYILTNDKTNKL